MTPTDLIAWHEEAHANWTKSGGGKTADFHAQAAACVKSLVNAHASVGEIERLRGVADAALMYRRDCYMAGYDADPSKLDAALSALTEKTNDAK